MPRPIASAREAIGRGLGLRDIEIVEIRESRAQDAERRRYRGIDRHRQCHSRTRDRSPSSTSAATISTAQRWRRLLRQWRAEDRPAACFIIGGADGLAQSLRERAKLKLAFGAATWPHQLVRIMLLEQIYRAGTILAGHPYHRA